MSTVRTTVAFALVAAGCWGAPKPSTTLSNNAAKPAGLFTITPAAFGPLDAKSPATLDGLRKLLAGYDVKPVNDGSLEYDVFQGAERLFYVVPNDDGTLFNVHAVSPKVGIADRAWRVGAAFQGSNALTTCECWGENPTCFKKGEHVAVNFKRECGELTAGDPRALKVLDGLLVQRVIWSPTAFGEDSGSYGGQEYGGGLGNPCGGGGNPCGGNPCGGD